jgi:PKD repeat protein
VSLTGAACWLAPVADASGGPQIVAYDVPTTAQVDVPATFDATVTDSTAAIGSINWSFGDGSAATSGAQTSHAWGAPGTYTVTVTATDALDMQTSESFLVEVVPGPAAVDPVTTTTPPPALTFGATQSRARWTRKRGTVFTLSSNVSAAVTLSFARRGKRNHMVGVASARPLATLSTNVVAGQQRIRFDGRLGAHRKLTPGNYTVTFTASAAGASAAPITLDFVVRRN